MEYSSSASKGRVPKKKWKILTAFAMKGGEGSRVPLSFFSQFFCLKTNVTRNMDEYGSWRSQQPANDFEPIMQKKKNGVKNGWKLGRPSKTT